MRWLITNVLYKLIGKPSRKLGKGLPNFRSIEHFFRKGLRNFRTTEHFFGKVIRNFRSTEHLFRKSLRNSRTTEHFFRKLRRLHQSGGKKQFEGRRKSGFIERKRRIVQKGGEMAAASNFGNEVVQVW